MNLIYRYANRRIIVLVFLMTTILTVKISLQQYNSVLLQNSSVTTVSLQSNSRNLFKNVSIVHYTTLYGKKTDSKTKIFNDNLQQICHIRNQTDYELADTVFVSLIDLINLPDLSYRNLHRSQLWIFYSEESPRNSYKTVKMKDITYLDNWFNLTATLKPESDFHIQYRGYRIKPSIGEFLEKTFNLSLKNEIHSKLIYQPINTSSTYINTLSIILNNELNNRINFLLNTCPYTCNKAIPNPILTLLEPHLKPIELNILNRDVVYIAWFVSNCNTHSRREDFVNKLRLQKNIRIDIYGNCKSVYHSPIINNSCEKTTLNCMKNILLNYRFYLSFENSKCDTYITEKYWIQGLHGHAVPIVLGAKKEQYQRLVVPNSYIHVDDYSTIEDLANELHRLNRNDSDFRKYLQWTQLYDVSDRYQFTSFIDIHAALCLLGHYQYLHSLSIYLQETQYLMKTIQFIFNITNMFLSNFNWTTATTNLVRISEFYNPKVNCWDSDYPSIFKQIYNHLFTWW